MPKSCSAIFTGKGSCLEQWAAWAVTVSILICTLLSMDTPPSQREKAILPVRAIFDEQLHPPLHSEVLFSISGSGGKCLSEAQNLSSPESTLRRNESIWGQVRSEAPVEPTCCFFSTSTKQSHSQPSAHTSFIISAPNLFCSELYSKGSNLNFSKPG